MRRLLLALVLFPALAFGQAQLKQITASQLGLSAAALSGGVTSTPVYLLNQSSAVSFNQVTFQLGVTKGTSSTMTATCAGSVDYGVTYRSIERCADGTTFTCTAATWSYDLTTQTSFLLNVPVNYTHLKCTFTATGTGTLTATAVLNTI